MKKKKITPAQPKKGGLSKTIQKTGRINLNLRNLQKTIPISTRTKQAVKRTILKTFSFNRYKKPAEINLCFVKDQAIRKLNARYLGKNYATDVICFDLSKDTKKITADIAISTDTLVRNAKIFATPIAKELHLYVIHGIMHLLGYNDDTGSKRKIMEEKSMRILSSLKI